MSASQAEKIKAFRKLHEGPGAFIIANAFDAGSARILAGLGYAAVATSSGAFAGTLGRRDGKVSREEALGHARLVVEAVEVPVSADLENGFGHPPAFAAETVSMASAAGLAGCTIEDATGDKDRPLYPFEEALERVKACVAAARGAGNGFVLTARTENFLRGNPDLEDTIRRLKAFEAAGADVLMAPGLPDLAAVKAVCSAVGKPVNFMAGIKGRSYSTAELAEAGVRRISLATSLWRAAMDGMVKAAKEAQGGTFGYIDTAIGSGDLAGFMRG